MIKKISGSNRRQRLKTLLNDAKWLLLVISAVYTFVELGRVAFAKNGEET